MTAISQSAQIAARLEEVYLTGTWVANTNYKKALQGLTRQQALQTAGDHNSIALLVFHVNYYLDGLIGVLRGGPLDIRDKYSFDMPPITSAKDWEELHNSFLNNAETFIAQVKALPDSILEEDFTDPKYGSYRRNLEGVIEHSYYHLGQLVMIRKMISS